MHAFIPSVLALLALTSGCQVGIEVEEVHLTYRNIGVTGAGGLRAAKKQFVYDELGPIQQLIDRGAEVLFVGAQLRATSGIETMTFVEETSVHLASGDPASGLPRVRAYHCKGDCVVEGTSLTITLPWEEPANDYIQSGSIAVDLDLAGPLPSKDWMLDVDITLTATLDYTYIPQR